MKIQMAIVSLALLTSACATTAPKLASPGLVPDDDPDIATRLVTHLLCEIRSANTFDAMKTAEYSVVANLKVSAEVQKGVAPKADFLTTYSDSKRHTLLGGEVSQTNSATLTEEVTVALEDIADMDCSGKTHDLLGASDSDQIVGRFGVKGLLERPSNPKVGAPVDTSGFSKEKLEAYKKEQERIARLPNQTYGVLNPKVTKFGSTIEFTLKRSLSGGPHWELVHFTGPSGDGALSYQRTDISTLAIEFALPPPDDEPKPMYLVPGPKEARAVAEAAGETPPSDKARRKARAAEAARQGITQMILQNLNLNRR